MTTPGDTTAAHSLHAKTRRASNIPPRALLPSGPRFDASTAIRSTRGSISRMASTAPSSASVSTTSGTRGLPHTLSHGFVIRGQYPFLEREEQTVGIEP